AGALCCLLVAVIGGAALAQTSSPADSSAAPAESSAKDGDMPPGGCKPIGLTVSGEVVFPLQCREFIERQKAMAAKPAAAEVKPADAEPKPSAAEAKAATAPEKPAVVPEKPAVAEDKPPLAKDKSAVVEDKPAAAEEKPTTADAKAATKPSDDAAIDNSQPGIKPGDTIPLPKRADRRLREHAAGEPGCTRFRTYDAASGTYRGFDGRTHPCR
ncbi:MAG TPA: BA14K family protein, partial [Bradyrhizobium sp.]|nr:BA14K family protein [Bradyrhizobium sp.]